MIKRFPCFFLYLYSFINTVINPSIINSSIHYVYTDMKSLKVTTIYIDNPLHLTVLAAQIQYQGIKKRPQT